MTIQAISKSPLELPKHPTKMREDENRIDKYEFTEEVIKQCTPPATQSLLLVGEGHDGMDAGERRGKTVRTI